MALIATRGIVAAQAAEPYVDVLRWRYDGLSKYHDCTPPADIQGLTEYTIALTTIPAAVDASGDRAFGIQAASNLAVTGFAGPVWIYSGGKNQWIWSWRRDGVNVFVETFDPGAALRPAVGVRRNHVFQCTDNGADHTLRWYLDGNLIRSVTRTDLSLASLFSAATPANKVYVGFERGSGYSYYMRGDVDNLVICSGVVDPSEFDTHVAGGGKDPAGIPGMLHAWTLDKPGDTTTAMQDYGANPVTMIGHNTPTPVAN